MTDEIPQPTATLRKVEGGKKDGAAAENEPDYVIEVRVDTRLLAQALGDSNAWRALFDKIIPVTATQAIYEFKAFVLNGFKPVTSQEELLACRDKMLKIEAPKPSLTIVKSLPAGLKNRGQRRK